MRMGKWIFAGLILANACVANNLSQLYEKAYFLETAKGQTEEALDIYREIAATKATDENRAAVIRALNRLQNIYTIQQLPTSTNDELFKKASRLRTLDHHDQAAEILEKLCVIPGDSVTPNTHEHTFHSKVLEALLEIAFLKNDQTAIANYQSRLLKETDETINSLTIKTPPGGTVYLPEGIYSGNKLAYHHKRNIWVDKKITIKGTDRNKCIIEGTMDVPLIRACSGSKLTLDSLTIKSQTLSYSKDTPFLAALNVENNGSAIVTNCNFIALSNHVRSLISIQSSGFSKLNVSDCRFDGYAVPIFMKDASVGLVQQCVLQQSQSGIMTGKNTDLTVNGTIIRDAKFAAINCQGGNLRANNTLITDCGRATTLRRETESCVLSNSVIMACGEPSASFSLRADSQGLFQFVNSIFYDNDRTPNESSNPLYGQVTIIPTNNTFWSSEIDRIDQSVRDEKTNLVEDPQFKDPVNGDFTPLNPNVVEAGHGLSDPKIIFNLWKKYEETCK